MGLRTGVEAVEGVGALLAVLAMVLVEPGKLGVGEGEAGRGVDRAWWVGGLGKSPPLSLSACIHRQTRLPFSSSSSSSSLPSTYQA